MATETWANVSGYEGLYQVSDQGRVRACAACQRYTHWRTGAELFRRVKERPVVPQRINSGYLIVHLYRGNKRTALLVHRLVAAAFVSGDGTLTVNHKNGDKADNRAANLEWATHGENHAHAVAAGLNTQARRVTDPRTGIKYPSMAQAAKRARVSLRTIRKAFIFEQA